MDFLLGCSCFGCSLTSSKGTYNTYDRERQQPSNRTGSNKNNNSTKSTCESEKSNCQTSDTNETSTPGQQQQQQHLHQRQDQQEQLQGPLATNQMGTNEADQADSLSSGGSSKKRNGGGGGKRQKESSSTGAILSQFNLDGIAELINGNKINKSSVIVLVGAGMSTAAGVPDFRSPSTGIYANLQKYNLSHPEDVFKIDYFKNNPAPFYDLSRQILPDKLFPTLSHYFVRLLHEKGYLLRCFSQNVDCLESLCGLPKEKLCLAHGSFETGHCLRCNAEYSLAWMRKIVEQGGIPHCTQTQDCKGLIKPDVKFFGERLDGRFFRLAKEDFPKCELLIIIGSSLTVMPFAQLVQRVPANCPRLLINKTKSGHDLPMIFRLFRSSDGLMYDKKGNTRDVAFIGDCDEAVLQLSTKLAWNGDLIEMARARRQELDQEQAASN